MSPARFALAASCAAAALALGSPAFAAPTLMPLPQTLNLGEGALPIAGAFVVAWDEGCRDAFLDRALTRFQADLERLTGVELKPGAGPRLEIACRPDPARAGLEAREAYRLSITPQGVRLEADGPLGVLRGLATLRQIVETSPVGVSAPTMTVDDRPRFVWRGVMIDTARHFMALPTLKRQIDAMEAVKLNVLHLHLSDNEGFRVESRRYPRLHEVASGGRYYTQDQIRELVAYAADRGVRIVPEFDVPGHTKALIEAYPELGARPAKAAGPMAIGGPALSPASETTYHFLERLFGEMAGLFPDAYFHAGGDEVNAASWAGDPQIEALKAKHGLADKAAVEAYFHGRIREILRRHGKTMIGWEEVAASGALPRDVVVQAWQTSNATAHATAKGHRTIVSAGYYLDLLDPAAYHYAIDPLDTSAAGLTPAEAQAGRKLHPLVGLILTDALVANPLPALTQEQEALVLGGEAPVWAELVTDEMLDARLWPRAAALAERFWSRRDVRDPADMYRRLAVQQDRLRAAGLQDRANRARMASRLAPGASEPLLTLLDLVGSVRHMAHDKRVAAILRGEKVVQHLNAAADAAPVDSLVARGFVDRAGRYAGGERNLALSLRADFDLWDVNHRRLTAMSAQYPSLAEVLPVSADIAELAAIGTLALDAIETGRPLAPEAAARGQAILARCEAFEEASARPIFAFFGKQPPGDLIVMVTPGVRALLEKAAGLSAGAAIPG